MPPLRRFAPVFLAAAGAATAACGGGVPLLHPAHVLPARQLSMGAGVSGQFAFGKARTAIETVNAPPGTVPIRDPNRAFLEGAIAQGSLSPGVAPWVGARAGLGGGNETGATFTGRALRVDARHAFLIDDDGDVALSLGLGASGVLNGGPRESGNPHFEAKGFGVDLPVLVGWRSAASIVELWAGVRGGFERITGDTEGEGAGGGFSEAAPPPPVAHLVALRGYGAALVGGSIGLKPFSVALELDVAYQGMKGSADFSSGTGADPKASRLDATVSGLTVAPSGAIIGKF